MSRAQAIYSGVVAVALLVVYTALTIAGHDGTLVLGLFAGQVGQAGLQAGVAQVKPGG